MPVFKKGDKSLASNYRPISLTCILCKVLEHILASNIVKHLDGQGLMNDQYGIRGRELAWIRAFLGSRSQQEVIDGEEWESIPVTSSGPRAQSWARFFSLSISMICLMRSTPG